MSKITIYGFAQSTYVRTARMACEEKGIAYELEPIDYGSDSHGEVHPYRRMPAMRNGSIHLFETLAIASWADASGGEGPDLQPADSGERALMLQWISSVNDYVYPDLVRALLEDEPSPDAPGNARARLEPLDQALRDSEWLAGRTLSLADLFLAPIDAFAEQTLSEAGALEGLDGLAAWRSRVQARPSFASTAP